MNQVKSRDISILEYLECLIREYFQADMRAHIYRKRSDKNYWSKTAGHKADKILDITTRNKMPNIFDNQESYDKYYDRCYPIGKLPVILDNEKDLKMYYSENADVTVHDDRKVLVGRIESVDFHDEEAIVTLFDDNTRHIYKFGQIRRIL